MQVGRGIHRLTQGVANFYVIEEGSKLVLVDAERRRTMASYRLHAELYRTVWTLGRNRATRILPVAEVSSFADGEVIDVPGKPRAIHAPGHTPGSSALLFESSRVLMTGDVIVTRNPLTGRVGPQIMPSAFNHDTAQALGSVDALSGVAADTLLAGHGEPWTDGVDEAVRRARAAGAS